MESLLTVYCGVNLVYFLGYLQCTSFGLSYHEIYSTIFCCFQYSPLNFKSLLSTKMQPGPASC